MSANATGTPTANFSIPKFNTASDAPNGKGTNEMMDAIDALLANTFVRPKITTGTLGAGPPGSPAAGDIWIAQNVDGNGSSWMFTYNPAETTYKWEFIGGPSLYAEQNSSGALSVGSYAADGGLSALTATRAGDYDYQYEANIQMGASGSSVNTASMLNGVATRGLGISLVASAFGQFVMSWRIAGNGAATTFNIGYNAGAAATVFSRSHRLTPVRII